MTTRVRKNSEKRKAKSRDAARVRRSTESEIFSEISCLLPVCSEAIQQMDKISIVRLAVAYLRTASALDHSTLLQGKSVTTSPTPSLTSAMTTPTSGSSSGSSSSSLNNIVTSALATDFSGLRFSLEQQQVPQGLSGQNNNKTHDSSEGSRSLTNEDMVSVIASTGEVDGGASAALEGFLILLSGDGSIAFVADDADALLGLNPLDMMGNSLFDYVHLCDHQELNALLTPTCVTSDDGELIPASGFNQKFIRVKNTLTARGKRVNLNQATYRVLRFSGKYLGNGMILALMESLPNACTVIDRFLGCQVILSKHSLDMKFTHIDKSLCESIFGFREADILGTSFYQYFHPLDAPVVESSLRDLYAKGQVETPAYRFLAKDGSCIWIVSQWTLVRDSASAAAAATAAAAAATPSHGHPHPPLLTPAASCPLLQQTHPPHSSHSTNLQHHFNQSQSNYILSIHFVISTDRSSSSNSSSIDCASTSAEAGEEERLTSDIQLLLSDEAVVSHLTPVPASPPLPPDSSLQGTLASQLLSTTAAAASFLPASVGKITATDSVFAPRTEDMSSGFLMLTGDEKSPLTIIHDSVIETDPAHDLTHLAPEVGDSDSFPLDLDNLPAFDGFDMEDLLGLSARSEADTRTPGSSSTTDSSMLSSQTPGAMATDSVFCGSEGSSPFSLESRCSGADDFSNQQLQDVMSGGSANCSPFSLESDSSDQFSHQDDHRNVMSDGAFPFSLESLVSDVVVSSPGEEDPDIMMMPFCRSSSIGDSPPSSSRSFDCDSDLDLYSNCNTDLGLFTDDTFLDSLLTSNLPDVISNAADDIMSSLHNCNDTANTTTTTATNGLQMNSHLNSLSSGNNSRDFFLPSLSNTKLPPPLPLTSSLATLLQQKTIMSSSTPSGNNNNASNNNNNKTTSSSSSGSGSKASFKGTGHGNSTHATNSHILVQNGQHFTIYKILAAPSGTAAGSGAASSSSTPGSISSQMDVATSQKGVAKRFLSGVSSHHLTPSKRIHLDSGPSSVYHPKPVNGNSVLMNLLVNGEDVRNGYTSRKSSSSTSAARSRTTTYSCPFD